MRQIIEVEQVTCNNCGKEIQTESDLHIVTLKIDGTDYDTDWCSPCHHKLMRSVTVNGADPLACGFEDCEFVAKSEAGLRTHRTRKNHPRTRRAQL